MISKEIHSKLFVLERLAGRQRGEAVQLRKDSNKKVSNNRPVLLYEEKKKIEKSEVGIDV